MTTFIKVSPADQIVGQTNIANLKVDQKLFRMMNLNLIEITFKLFK